MKSAKVNANAGGKATMIVRVRVHRSSRGVWSNKIRISRATRNVNTFELTLDGLEKAVTHMMSKHRIILETAPPYGEIVGCGQELFLCPGKSGAPPPPIKGLSSDLWLGCGAVQPPLSRPTAKHNKAKTVIQILLFIDSTPFYSTLS